MKPLVTVRGAAAPLLVANIDTDTIAPTRKRFAVHVAGEKIREKEFDTKDLFSAWRYLPDGEENEEFILNRSGFRRAPILISGPNFGCGSSREQAVWMLESVGIRVIIAPSFGPIFFDSCFKSGILPITLDENVVTELADECGKGTPEDFFEVSLPDMTIKSPSGKTREFFIPAFRRKCLIDGIDELQMVLAREEEISKFRQRDSEIRPWIYRTL